MRPSFAPVLVLVLALATSSSIARADLPPPAGYVESCTAAIQTAQSGDVCVECGTYFAEATRCADTHGAQGYAKRCQSWGASTWTEVWCRPRTAADGPPPAPPAASPAPPAASPAPPAASPAPPAASSSVCSVAHARSRIPRLALVLGGALLAALRASGPRRASRAR